MTDKAVIKAARLVGVQTRRDKELRGLVVSLKVEGRMSGADVLRLCEIQGEGGPVCVTILPVQAVFGHVAENDTTEVD